MSRCYECCQENCGFTWNCTCWCHAYWKAASSTTIKIDDPLGKLGEGTVMIDDRCKEHRRYQAKRPPRSTCEACWRYYFKRNP